MDKIRVVTNRPLCFEGKATPAGTEVQVAPSVALDVVNGATGRLVDPDDELRLRKWSTAQHMRRNFSGSY